MVIVYKGRRVMLDVSKVVLPNGREMNLEKIVFPHAVAALPIYEGNKVVLLRQFRPVVNDYVIEIPAGVIEEGENPEEALTRELSEEIGAEIDYFGKLFEGFTTPGYSTEYMVIYYVSIRRLGEPRPEPHEVIDRIVIDLRDAVNMVINGSIRDAKSALAITLYMLKKGAKA
ncbi:NUDIX hydrolase [Vulcanisaeta moutnovskia 768-28]|uniref:NUDIX hydrolase n=1 Tax=Vulcanisaeta moutnovskia (strain 768-28) TaxID=985053 RepID=F0QVX5_VULM7|nr:NUDIX hydrolase [Vulcanisaeta moutnovskia]ADY00899.1 NUDIX hydrolase [Vulcanisaeta moutnovskia 768-28]